MHELNICLNLLDLLTAQAEKEKFSYVKTLWLEVGELAGIELSALQFSFPIAAAGTLAKNATLKITSIEGQAWCDTCQNNVRLKAYFDPCLHCGEYGHQITQGKELKIVKMEVE